MRRFNFLTLFIVVLLFFSLSLPLASGDTTELEDVDVTIVGRCSSVYEFKGLQIGFLKYCGIGVEKQFPIGEKINVYTDKGDFKHLDDHIVFMHNATGLFFWGQFVSFSQRILPFPPLVFIRCHADKMYLEER